MNPLRVAFACRSFPFHRQGGMEWHAWDLANGLARKGHRIRVVTTSFDPDALPSPGEGTKDSGTPRPKNASIHSREAGTSTPAWCAVEGTPAARNTLRYFRGAAQTVAQWADRKEIDLVHPQGFAGAFLGFERLRRLAVPVVVTIHGTLWSETMLDFRSRRGLPGWRQAVLLWKHRHRLALRPAYERMLRGATLLIVDSEFTRDELIRDHPEVSERIRVIGLGVDPARFAYRPSDRKRRLTEPVGIKNRAMGGGSVGGGSGEEAVARDGMNAAEPIRLLALGRLERSKGFKVALEALARCRTRNWVLRIAGEGPERGALERRAESLGFCVTRVEAKSSGGGENRGRMSPSASDGEEKARAFEGAMPVPRVEFAGRISDSRLSREYADADVFLNPDLTQPAFGLVALEAMMQATPVLASRVGAMPEVLGTTGGWLAPAGDPEGWGRALEALMRNGSDALARCGLEARRAALSRFSLDAMIQATEDVYREALRIRGRG